SKPTTWAPASNGPRRRWRRLRVRAPDRLPRAIGARRSRCPRRGPTRRRHHWMPGRGKERGGKPRPRREKDDKGWQKKQKRKVCIFCKDHVDYVDYKDVVTLRKFVRS